MKNKNRKTPHAPSLCDAGEWGFLRRLLPRLKTQSPSSFLVAPGDDAVVLTGRSKSVLSIDGLTEGTHFKSSWASTVEKILGVPFGRALGWKLMGSGLSDLAAMGDTAHRWAMIYLGAPPTVKMNFLFDLYTGVREAAKRSRCVLAGGDTVRAHDLSLVVAVGGTLTARRPLTRTGAKPGDVVCVTGHLGDAAAGLAILMKKKKIADPLARRYFVKRFFQPTPRFLEARALSQSKAVTSLMDLSDPLNASARILADASQVGINIQLEKIPVSTFYRRLVGANENLMSAGEDYELLFTLPVKAVPSLQRKIKFIVIGRVGEKKEGVQFFRNGRPFRPSTSFEHF